MYIRKALQGDFETICGIYERARAFMRESGNPTQWSTTHPSTEQLRADIEAGELYVCCEGDEIAAVFFYKMLDDPTYREIFGGKWLNDLPYGVVHRIASARKVRGAAEFSINWAFSQCGNLRIDTHADNVPMRSLLSKLGFTACGTIYVYENRNGERVAYQKTSGEGE